MKMLSNEWCALACSAVLTPFLAGCGAESGGVGLRAVADSAITSPSAAVTIDVLSNDISSNGTRLLAAFDATSPNGAIVRDDNGTPEQADDRLVYTPNGGFTGTDIFEYTLDNGASKTARGTVTVTVTEATFASDDFATVATNSSGNAVDVLANDAAGMVVSSVNTAQTRAGATVTVGAGGSNVSYTPPAGFQGSDRFDYTAERNVGGNVESDTATVFITVQSVPTPTNACRTDITARLNAGQGYCYDAQLTTVNGIRIDMTVYVPHPDQLKANAEATLGGALPGGDPGFAPLLIHSHGFGGYKAEDLSNPDQYLDQQVANLAWESGYFVISYTQRGFGGDTTSGRQPTADNSSSGQIGMMAPRKEGFDFVDVVNWANAHLRENFQFDVRSVSNIAYDKAQAAHKNPNVTPAVEWGRSLLMTDAKARASSAASDLALATIGYSYGGGFQFNAQSVDPRVDAIMPMGTWFDLRYSLHPNDAPKVAWITIMTAFAQSGGNGEDLPPTIVDGNQEANGANAQPADQPHNKPRQVSMRTANKLGPNGTVGYCDGGELLNPDPGFVPLADESEPTPVVPPNAVVDRAMRAHLFMIQGYQDTLFNFNEGYDNARCFESQGAAGLDVRMLQQTSGHPLPAFGPAHYAGSDTSMYLDEIVHCGLDGGVPKKFVMKTTGLAWFDFHLRGLLPPEAESVDDIFPQVCITQTNTNTDLKLKVGAENPDFSGTNSSANAYAYSREGAVFNSVAAVPRGCRGAAGDCPTIDVATANGGAGFVVTTGPDPTQQNPAGFLPLYTATNSRVMAGIPLADLSITRANPTQDEMFFVGVGVKRCHANSADGNGSGTDCGNNSPQLLHFQVTPMRVFPTAAADAAGLGPTLTAPFPKDDPRSQPSAGNPGHYPIRWGDNPGFASIPDTDRGRLLGITARLFPGDVVGLMFYGEHPVFKSLSSAAAGRVTITGTVQLPLLAPSAAPSDVPAYVLDGSAP